MPRLSHHFKNIAKNPQASLGIIKISPDGKSYELLWGFENGGSPTSELASHFLAHQTRLDCEEKHRVIMHAHPTNLVAMTFVHSLDEREFTRTLWRMCTECMMIFPEGIAVLPWMLCGTAEIGAATAEKMKDQRLVVWANHGIFGAGKSLDDAFGLLETVEKAAEIYMKIGFKKVLQSITDTQLNSIANAYNVKPKKGYLDLDL
ncbi:MAG: rhamnulose-1-phosphate aldolase [Clostridia bacterium]